MVDSGVEFHGSRCRNRCLKARNIVEGETKDGKPIDQPIARYSTQRQKLLETWTIASVPEGTVEVMRNITEVIAGNEIP